jgi:hypothetical protein
VKTPREKYLNDPHYHALVNSLRALIEKCEMTPSEVREAAILACILYEENTVRSIQFRGGEILEAEEGRIRGLLQELEKWTAANS